MMDILSYPIHYYPLQVNLLVVFIGLWNGMVLLPVLLSFMGTAPYLSAQMNYIENGSHSKPKISDSAADNLALDTQEDNYMVNRLFASQGQTTLSSSRSRSFLRRQELVWNPRIADYEVFVAPRPLDHLHTYNVMPPDYNPYSPHHRYNSYHSYIHVY